MTETGVVKKIIGDKAVVAVVRKSSCGESCAGCTGGCRLSENTVTAENNIGAKAGDVVEIEGKAVLKKAFLVYIMPPALFFIAYFAAFAITNHEKTAVICAVCTFLAVFAVLHFLDKSNRLATKISIARVIKRF